jgi:cell filamentation protein
MRVWQRDVLGKHPATALAEDGAFCRAVAEIQGEFLVIHPFREGNARTIKLLTDLLATQTGRRPLVYDQSDEGRRLYINAAEAAFRKEYSPLSRVIRQGLENSR